MVLTNALFWGLRPRGQVRVRFAPSPTGPMHIGGLRTALYNYLFAHKFSGSFLLRIEDTDQSRCLLNSSKEIINCLEWAGLNIDEGPYYQSKRLSIYQRYCKQLIADKKAYPCFCTSERIQISKSEANDQCWRYDNRCSNLDPQVVEDRLMAGKRHTVRFRIQNCTIRFDDLVYGRIGVNPAKVEGDFIIMRSDGWPTYHLACVVDDHLMEISHVLRGVEWQQSTGKHLQLYNAFGWPPPVFCHLPLIVKKGGKKISKRDSSSVADIVKEIRKRGIYPEALLSYVTQSGGAGLDSLNKPRLLPDLVRVFDPFKFSKSLGTLSYQDLLAENRSFISQGHSKSVFDLKKLVYRKWYIKLSDEQCIVILKMYSGHASFIEDIATEIEYLWKVPRKIPLCNKSDNIIRDVVRELELGNYDIGKISMQLTNNYDQYNHSDILKFIRMITTGCKSGPPLSSIMEIMGTDEFLNRLKRIIT